MATQNKTQETEVSVTAFLNDFVENDQKKEDSLKLIELMRDWSGFEAKMWGPTIIGFGRYRYKYPSGREGEAPLIAFSPRKAEFSLCHGAGACQSTSARNTWQIQDGQSMHLFQKAHRPGHSHPRYALQIDNQPRTGKIRGRMRVEFELQIPQYA